MKKNFTIAKLTSGLFWACAGIALFAGSATAQAAEVEIEPGVNYGGLSIDNPFEGYFTAESNGTLTVLQTGSSDSHLFPSADNFSESNALQADGYTSKGNVYTLTYAIGKGKTVYFYGPLSAYDDLKAVEFKWEGNEQGLPVIVENQPFKAYQELMEYTPEMDGILTITTSAVWQFNWASPAGAGLLFTDLGHNIKVNLEYVGSEADMEKAPSKYTAPVTKGTTYYFYNSLFTGCEFTFSLAPIEAVSLVEVLPTPGMTFDYGGDYGAGVLLSFDPKTVEFEHAYITYTPAGSTKEETVELINVDGQIGENGQYEYTEGYWKFQAVSLYFARAAKGTDLTLKLTGVNYNGLPLSVSTLDNDAVVVADGNLSITWTRPAVDMEIVNQTWPKTLYSNSQAGDPAMIATVEFNEDVISVPSVSLTFGTQYYGSPSGGDVPDPSINVIPCEVNGKVLTIDFSGIDLGAVYSQGAKDYNKVTVFVGNIIGADGQKFNEENPGIAQRIDYVNSPAPNPEFLPAPSYVYENDLMFPAFIIYWNQELTEVVEGQTLQGQLTVPSGETVNVTLVTTNYDPTVDQNPDNTDDDSAVNEWPAGTPTFNALLLSMNSYISEYGEGNYTLSIGSIVKNVNGLVNAPAKFVFTVESLGSESELKPTYVYADDLVTINWDNQALSVYNPNGADIKLFNDNVDYNIPANAVTIVNNTAQISLEGLDLTEGEAYTLLIGEAYFWVGDNNEYNAAVTIDFKYMESSAVNGIEKEDANNAVYNLNGVKVGNSVNGLAKGVYIINGKKVYINK